MSSSLTFEKEELEKIIIGFAVQAQRHVSDQFQRNKKRVIIIAGPTGCGKSDFSLMLAREVGGEIISADSMQIYKGMDIGTAKPSKEVLAEIPHHLIDTHHISEPFNVVDFYYEARHCIQKILARGAVPIVVGGSGFYLHSLIYGPPSGPPSVPELRKALEEQMERDGAEAMFEKLKHLDIEYAKTITKNDKQKIVRAMEIISLTGKKVSQLQWKARRNPLNYCFRSWFLYRPMEKLYQRIEKRCGQMLERGFLDEVKNLKKEGLCENLSASRAIGYRQALDFLETDQSEAEYKRFVEQFKQASRNYAKRQMTWFRKRPLFNWLDVDLHDMEIAVEMVKRDYESGI